MMISLSQLLDAIEKYVDRYLVMWVFEEAIEMGCNVVELVFSRRPYIALMLTMIEMSPENILVSGLHMLVDKNVGDWRRVVEWIEKNFSQRIKLLHVEKEYIDIIMDIPQENIDNMITGTINIVRSLKEVFPELEDWKPKIIGYNMFET